MTRVLRLNYVRLPAGAAPRALVTGIAGTLFGVGVWTATAIQGGNLKIDLPNGLQGLLVPTLIMMATTVVVLMFTTAVATSKGERIEPDNPSGTSVDELLPPAPIVTRRSETEVVTTRRDETVSLADRDLADKGERKPTDLLKRQGGAPDPATVADAGRNQGQDKSRDRSSQTGDERQNAPPKPATPPAPAQPAAPSATASATVSVTGEGVKKSSVDA